MKLPTLHILLIQDDEAWSAQCLEHDIAAQGKTRQEAVAELTYTIEAELALRAARGVEGLSDIPRAPDDYWRQFVGSDPSAIPAPRCAPFQPEQGAPPAFMIPEFREYQMA